MSFDFFIVHARKDDIAADALFSVLVDRGATAFLDVRSLRPGDRWDVELRQAQRESTITVVLISETTEDAFYAQEEIAQAIVLSRKPESEHKVVPVYLSQDAEVPYGLRRIQSLRIGGDQTLNDVADQLLRLVDPAGGRMPADPDAGHSGTSVAAGTLEAVQEVRDRSRLDVLVRGDDFLVLDSEATLLDFSTYTKVLLITDHAESGSGQAHALAHVRGSIQPALKDACRSTETILAWANIAGVLFGNRSALNAYLSRMGIRYAGCHLFSSRSLIATEKLGRVGFNTERLIDAGVRMVTSAR